MRQKINKEEIKKICKKVDSNLTNLDVFLYLASIFTIFSIVSLILNIPLSFIILLSGSILSLAFYLRNKKISKYRKKYKKEFELIEAFRKGDHIKVDKLLSEGADYRFLCIEKSSFSAIESASDKGYYNVFETLVKHYRDVFEDTDVLSEISRSCMSYAIVDLVLKHTKSKDFRIAVFKRVVLEKVNPIAVRIIDDLKDNHKELLERAIYAENIEIIKLILEKGFDPNFEKGYFFIYVKKNIVCSKDRAKVYSLFLEFGGKEEYIPENIEIKRLKNNEKLKTKLFNEKKSIDFKRRISLL